MFTRSLAKRGVSKQGEIDISVWSPKWERGKVLTVEQNGL